MIPQRRKWQPTPVSCLENPMDPGAWWATVQEVVKSQTRLSMHLLWEKLRCPDSSWMVGGNFDLESFGSIA